QHVRIAERDLRAVPVVDRNQLHAFIRRGALQAVRDVLGELIIRALGRVAESEELLAKRSDTRSVQVLADLVDQAAALERVEQPERHALREPAARRDFAEREALARRPKCREEFRGVNYRLDEI